MSDHPLIQVSGVSKKFNRCLKTSLWYGLHDLAGQFLGRQDQSRLREGEFWALRHVTFDLRKGDALAIVGNNGAGKSTLLKLLMGRLIPSAGRVRAHGKIAAISELGLGFNPRPDRP
ncbi:MAG: ATP-binding cassette domain-containing protein [Planctomycetota bacterium]